MLTVVMDTINSILGNTLFILVGESYGGYIVRGIIGKMKSQILGACFLCPLIIPDTRFRVLPNTVVKRYDDAFLDTLSQKEKTMFTELAIIANVNTYQRFKEEILPGIQSANQTFSNQLQKQYAFTFAIDSDVYDKPTLFIMGRQDQVVGYQDAVYVSRYYPRATLMILDMAGHNLQIEQPILFNALVKEWLQRIEYSKQGTDG